MTAEKSTWVYGVIPADASLEELERRQERLPADVWVVELGDLAAIVGDVPAGDAKAVRNQALAHAKVLEAAIVDAPVVPFRFGITVPGDDEAVARDLLVGRHDQLAQLLERVGDWVQLTLKVSYREDVVLREILDSEPEVLRLRNASREGPKVATRDVNVRLGELVSAAIEQRRQRDAGDIVEQLKPLSLAAVADDIEHDFMVLNAPFLVERERMEEFDQAAERVADERQERMQFRLLGPLPAYSFIEVEHPVWNQGGRERHRQPG